MTEPEQPPPTSRARRPGPGTRAMLAVVAALATALAGCERGLCPAAAFEADILVRLSEDWPAPGALLITVGCPESAECGFLRGPVTDDALPYTAISTVLRPPAVDVRVVEEATGREVAHHVLAVEYEPRGRQNRCGSGPAAAEVTVPYDGTEASGLTSTGSTSTGAG